MFFNNTPGDIFNNIGCTVQTETSCSAGTSTLLGAPINTEGSIITGFLQNVMGCEPCTSGKYITNLSDLTCSSCEKGKSNVHVGSVSADDCISCDVGTYENEFGSGRADCFLCPSGKSSNTVGASSQFECLKCPGENMFSVEGSSSCVCDKGYFMNDAATGNGTAAVVVITTCVQCPVGTNCDSPGSTLNNLKMLGGYWRPSTTSVVVIECDIKKHCPQDKNSTNSSSGCALGHDGPVCGLCMADYSMEEETCEICEGDVSATAFIPLAVAGFMVIVVALVYYWFRSNSGTGEDGVGNISSGVSAVRKQVSEKFELFQSSQISSYFRQFMAYSQIIGNLGGVMSVKFPKNFSRLVSWMSIFNLNLFGSFGCLIRTNHYDKLRLFTMIPIIIESLLIVVYFALSKFPKHQKLRNTVITVILSANFLILPTVSMVIFSTFNCRSFADLGTFLSDDYSVSCEDESYYSMRNYALLMAFVYPFGITAVNHFMLWRVKDKLNPPKDKNIISSQEDWLVASLVKRDSYKEILYLEFLYGSYKPDCWWFETFESIRRIALTGGLAFFDSGSPLQCIVGLLITVICIRTFAVKKPFMTKSINRFGEAVQWQIFITFLFSVLLLFADKNLELGEKPLIDFIFVGVTFVGPMFTVYFIFSALRGIREDNKLRNKLNQIAPIEDEDDVVEGSSKNIATISAEGGGVSSGLRHRGGNSNADEQGFSDIGGGGDVSETVLRLTAEISRLEEGFSFSMEILGILRLSELWV